MEIAFLVVNDIESITSFRGHFLGCALSWRQQCQRVGSRWVTHGRRLQRRFAEWRHGELPKLWIDGQHMSAFVVIMCRQLELSSDHRRIGAEMAKAIAPWNLVDIIYRVLIEGKLNVFLEVKLIRYGCKVGTSVSRNTRKILRIQFWKIARNQFLFESWRDGHKKILIHLTIFLRIVPETELERMRFHRCLDEILIRFLTHELHEFYELNF